MTILLCKKITAIWRIVTAAQFSLISDQLCVVSNGARQVGLSQSDTLPIFSAQGTHVHNLLEHGTVPTYQNEGGIKESIMDGLPENKGYEL